MQQFEGEFKMTAKTMFGLEQVLAKELEDLGAQKVKVANRAVHFWGDLEMLYKANYCLRSALRILVPIHTFQATSYDELYAQAMTIDWTQYIALNETFAIDPVVFSKFMTHSKFASLRLKDAIADFFMQRFSHRPSVEPEYPTIQLALHIADSNCTISLDSSGDPLHLRGYKPEQTEASISEVLAAGLILLAGWDGTSTFIDPMCGSGTLVTEAALLACNLPPQMLRKGFGFMNWRNFDAAIWRRVQYEAMKKRKDPVCQIYGSDISDEAIAITSRGLEKLELDDLVRLSQKSFFDRSAPAKPGLLMLNPPYGERLEIEDIVEFYKKIGDKLKTDFTGYEAWMITSSPTGIKSVGLKPDKKIQLFNGPLECRYLKYSLYEGSRKHVAEGEEANS